MAVVIEQVGLNTILEELQETGAVPDGPATGLYDITFDDSAMTVTIDGTYTDLTASASAAHVHIGATGASGPVRIGLSVDDDGAGNGSVTGSGVLSAEDYASAKAGGGYVNIHNSNFPGGELRGQIVPADLMNSYKGDDADDTITGTSAADIMAGGGGSDFLLGGASSGATGTAGAQVYRIYQATLDRAPDTGGFAGWVGQLESGASTVQSVVSGFVGSAEFQNVYGTLDNRDFVTLLYNNVLDRAPDQAGLDGWLDAMSNGTPRENVVTGFSESSEFKADTSIAASAYADALDGREQSGFMDDVFRLYQATLDRAPDATGLDGWSKALAGGQTYVSVAAGFTNSTEFTNTYGSLENRGFVEQLYRNVLDREADSGGLNGWLQFIEDGGTREGVVRGFAQSKEFVGDTGAAFETYMKAPGGDTLAGGSGDDTLYSGTTADTFVFDAAQDGTDRVLQIDTWDALRFEGFGYSAAADALAKMSVAGADVRFDDQGVEIVFSGADLATLQEVDYLFA